MREMKESLDRAAPWGSKRGGESNAASEKRPPNSRFMDIRLTKHAEEMLARRRIDAEWVQEVLEDAETIEPDSVDPALEHRLAPISKRGNRVLHVVLDPNVDPPRIITAFWDKRMRSEP